MTDSKLVGKSWEAATGVQRLERLRLAVIYLGLELEQKDIMERIFGKIDIETPKA